MKGPGRKQKSGARRGEDIAALCAAFATLRTAGEADKFLRDLTTPGELEAFGERWKIARLLDVGEKSYRDVAEETGASTTTVTRVARFLGGAHGGYRLVLDRTGPRKRGGK